MKKPLKILISDTNQFFFLGLSLALKAFFYLQKQPIQLFKENDINKNFDFIFLENSHACPAWLHDIYRNGGYPYVFFIKDSQQIKTQNQSCGIGTVNRNESIAILEWQLTIILSQQNNNLQAFQGNCQCINKLSSREIEVMKHLAAGLNGKEVGKELSISNKTVHAHQQNVMYKLNFRSKHELHLWLIHSGLVRKRTFGKYGAPWDPLAFSTTGNSIAV